MLKPSPIKDRTTGEPHAAPVASPRPAARNHRERNPLPLIGAALGAGIAIAKFIDWRGHARPRD